VYETLLFEARDGVGRLVLNRPERLNGITNRMMVEVYDCLETVAQRADIRVLVLTGAGKGFCPGADIKSYSSGEEDVKSSPRHFRIALHLHTLPQVTIAAINGACAGAGFGWACACDLRFAARSATFSSAFLNVASAGDMAGPWTLPRIVGAAKARELYFLPDKFGAEQARDMNLVNRVFEDEALGREVDAVAERLAAASPHALRTMKQNFLDAETLDMKEYGDLETKRHIEVMAHDDAREAFRAFIEKRPPRFGSAGKGT